MSTDSNEHFDDNFKVLENKPLGVVVMVTCDEV